MHFRHAQSIAWAPQVLAAQSCSGEEVVSTLLLAPRSRPLLYAKQMAKHKVGISNAIFKQSSNVKHMVNQFSF